MQAGLNDPILAKLPPPSTVNARIGLLNRELGLLRRLLRLSQAARDSRPKGQDMETALRQVAGSAS